MAGQITKNTMRLKYRITLRDFEHSVIIYYKLLFFCTFPSDDIDIKKVPDLLRD